VDEVKGDGVGWLIRDDAVAQGAAFGMHHAVIAADDDVVPASRVGVLHFEQADHGGDHVRGVEDVAVREGDVLAQVEDVGAATISDLRHRFREVGDKFGAGVVVDAADGHQRVV
jgi:hypothetical protein